MSSFKIGDRVIATAGYDNNDSIINQVGTILQKDSWTREYGVEFDHFVGGDDCGGRGVSGNCWYVDPEFLVPYVDNKVALLHAEGYNFKVLETIKLRQSKLISTLSKKYYVITTLYQLIRKGQKRHYRVLETDKTFKIFSRSMPDKFVSIGEAREALETMGKIVK